MGQAANQARQTVEAALAERRTVLQAEEAARKAAAQQIDVTLPGRGVEVGHEHPLTLTMQRLLSIFIGMGCEVHDRAGGGVVRVELDRAELSARPSRDGRAGQLLYH